MSPITSNGANHKASVLGGSPMQNMKAKMNKEDIKKKNSLILPKTSVANSKEELKKKSLADQSFIKMSTAASLPSAAAAAAAVAASTEQELLLKAAAANAAVAAAAGLGAANPKVFGTAGLMPFLNGTGLGSLGAASPNRLQLRMPPAAAAAPTLPQMTAAANSLIAWQTAGALAAVQQQQQQQQQRSAPQVMSKALLNQSIRHIPNPSLLTKQGSANAAAEHAVMKK